MTMEASTYQTLAFSMVKNEVDIIEPFVRHNLKFVDTLVVFDHFSSDGTMEVLLKLSREFDNLAIGTCDSDAQDQGILFTKMLRKFQEKFAANYVLFLDADEFISFENDASFSTCAANVPEGGVGLIPWRTFLPNPDRSEFFGDALDRFTLRRRREVPERYKILLRLDGKPADDFSIAQGSHSIRMRRNRRVPERVLDSVYLMHFPVRSVEQLICKGRIGSLTNGLRVGRNALNQATQWQRIARMERLQELGDSADFLFGEAMVYAQASSQHGLRENAEFAVHGISTIRRYSDGKRRSSEDLFKVEMSRIQSRQSTSCGIRAKLLDRLFDSGDKDDSLAIQYLVRKYGQLGIHIGFDLFGYSGFSTASFDDCTIHVGLSSGSVNNDFSVAQFDTLVARSLSGTKRLRLGIQIFRRVSGAISSPIPNSGSI